MSENSDNPMEAACQTAWREYFNGTYSKTDLKVFKYAFERGWSAHMQKQFDDFKRDREIGARARRTIQRNAR